MRGGLLGRRGKSTLLGLTLGTCELSLSYSDPDVNGGSLMSEEVDKHFIESHPPIQQLLSPVSSSQSNS